MALPGQTSVIFQFGLRRHQILLEIHFVLSEGHQSLELLHFICYVVCKGLKLPASITPAYLQGTGKKIQGTDWLWSIPKRRDLKSDPISKTCYQKGSFHFYLIHCFLRSRGGKRDSFVLRFARNRKLPPINTVTEPRTSPLWALVFISTMGSVPPFEEAYCAN